MIIKKNQKGFATPVIIAVIVVIAIIVAGVLVYRHDHNKSKTINSNTTTPASTGTHTPQVSNPYAGWKIYCDTTYKYCFRYPSTWMLASTSSQVTVTDPSQDVEVDYINAYSKDSSPIAFTPTSINKLSSANEDVTVVGGYSPGGGLAGAYVPSYHVVDSSVLSTYPLTIGESSQFPNNPSFTDKGISGTYSGAFLARPTTSINTTSDARGWLNGSNGQTSLQILKSFYYQ